jgi:hypothetical protein
MFHVAFAQTALNITGRMQPSTEKKKDKESLKRKSCLYQLMSGVF